MKLALAVALGIFLPIFKDARAAASGPPLDLHLRAGLTQQPLAPGPQPAGLQSGAFEQAIDHTGQLGGQTFAQRYWYDSEYASGPDAPVLYHICGEGDATYFLQDYAREWAKTLGARIVYLEHRYYGTSQPFSDLSSPHMSYLTIDNVLEDLASFQHWLAATQGWTGKWLALGGSYSGTVAALYRQRHPELVVGALATSAPMISGIGTAIGTADLAAALSPTNTTDDSGNPQSARQWAYQACTTFGFWVAEDAARGSTFDLPSSWLCRQVFGDQVALYDSNAYNQAHDLAFLAKDPGAPSNILFTYGAADVWTDIGLAGQTNQNGNITVEVIAGAGHHFDLNAPDPSDSVAVKAARARFVKLATEWLRGG